MEGLTHSTVIVSISKGLDLQSKSHTCADTMRWLTVIMCAE